VRRRAFITLIGGAAAWPLVAGAQQPGGMRRIGVLMGYAESDAAAQAQVAALRQELRKLGWEEGRNIHIQSIIRRTAEGDDEQGCFSKRLQHWDKQR
jgi:putative tryptophan/tyrosine transport system substrate-binding protein